jgi:hypothetical protein
MAAPVTTASAPNLEPLSRDGSSIAVPASEGPLWPLYALSAAATFVIIGVVWDISWHMSIGRDTLWSPPHLATYASAVVAGLTCGYIVLATTFRGSPETRARSVSFWGFRGPLGAWIAIWGAIAMLTSAPFDDWWHNAYGLDVKIVSPPHTLLSLGMWGIVVGGLAMTMAARNTTSSERRRAHLDRLAIYIGGIMVAMVAVYTYEFSFRGLQHSSIFYRASALALPLVLLALMRPSALAWPATTAAAIYMATRMLSGWILPLFPAEPLLGPIYNPIENFIPMQFPLLLFLPAFALDLVGRRVGRMNPPRKDWLHAPLYGIAFVTVLLAVQWPFADFLHSPAARNWFFWTDQFPYMVGPRSRPMQYQFAPFEGWTTFWKGIALALVFATISARLGLAWGRWFAAVRR